MDVKRKKFGFTPLEMKVSNRGSNRFLTGFTLVELLMVLGIIALLVGLLVPTLSWVRNTAREAKQKAQLTTIGLALEAFKNDYGDYPPSYGYDYTTPTPLDYCGTQKLAEALLGRDLLGFNKYSNWSATDITFYPTTQPELDASLDNRRGPYLELATTSTFTLFDLFVADGTLPNVDPLESNRFVICDVFGVKPVVIGTKTVKAGTPILYYRANTSSKSLVETGPLKGDGIYDYRDNTFLIGLGKIGDVMTTHPLWESVEDFYEYIRDPKVEAIPWPYRPDSYILISAGADGLYGTSDDITNFGN